MSEENKRFQEWLEKFNQFMTRSYAELHRIKIRTVKLRRLDEKEKKAKKRVKWYHFPTQKIRREITRGLGELYDIALAFAKEESLDLKEREKWARLAAYIAQTINTIIDSYDEMKIEQTLEELKQYVKLHLEEG